MGLGLTFKIALIAPLILFVVLAGKLKKVVDMVVLFSLTNTVLSAIFYVFYVPHLAVINPLVHIGTVSIIFLAVLGLITSKNLFDIISNVKNRRLN